MKMKFLLILAVVTLLFTPVMASADNLYPPEWAGGPLSTHAEWFDFLNVNDKIVEADTFTPGNITPAYIDLTGKPYNISGIVDGKLFLGTTDLDEPVVTIKALNFNNDNPLKRIRLQLTYDWNRTLADVAVSGIPSSGYDINIFQKDVPNYDNLTYFSAIDINMYPNPYFEKIDLTFTGGCNIVFDQIVLDTQCVPQTPIPGSLLLLGSGILGLVGIGYPEKIRLTSTCSE